MPKGAGDVALIAHSHLDIAYPGGGLCGAEELAHGVLIQLRLMDRYPDFKYTHTQPYVYETLEKYYPDVFAELQEKVARGQFEPVGAMWSGLQYPGGRESHSSVSLRSEPISVCLASG